MAFAASTFTMAPANYPLRLQLMERMLLCASLALLLSALMAAISRF
jgi:hypothetical protein